MPDAEPRPSFLERTLSSLRSRNFRLFFIGQTVSNTGNWLTLVALTLLVFHRTGSGVAVGVLSACQFGPILLLSAWAGVIIDRHDKRKLLFITQSLEMCQSFALAALAFMPHAPLPAFYVIAAAGGCLLAFDNPARRTFVNEMVPIEDVPNAVTLYSAMVNISRIAGPAIAGLLIVTVGYGWCFTIDGISYLTVITSLAMMRTSELRRVAVAARAKGQVRAGLKYITSVPELWITFAMLLIIGTISYNFTVVFPLYVEKGLHGSDAQYTLVYSAFSFGGLMGALLVARRLTVNIRTVASGAASLGLAMLVLAAVPNVAVAAIVAVGVGAASVAYMTATTSIAQIRSDQEMIGRVLAVQTVLLIGTTPIGGPILGLISDAFGARWPVFIGGIAAIGAAAFGLVAGRRAQAHITEIEERV
jgi:MFS family permease